METTGGCDIIHKGYIILPGDAPLLIEPGTHILPGMLQRADYVTSVVGKWHLGLGYGNGVYSPSYPSPAVSICANIELGNSSEPQLYNLNDDIGQ